ncbi:hypothetical protein ACLB2K_048065 [Fragaria x ananassa]
MHTPPIVDNSPINFNIDGDEVIGGETLDPLVRPQGRKASKEAFRKGKKASKDSSPLSSAVESIASNQKEATSFKKKLDEEFSRSLREENQRECIRLQLDLRKEAFLIQERKDRIKEREEQIMEKDTSNDSY